MNIKPPKPKLADDAIGTFDAIEAMKMAVFTEEETPEFKGIKPADSAFYASKEDDRYGKVKKIWDETPVAPRAEIVDILGKGLGWTTSFTTATPTRLVKNLGTLLMTPPQISVA